MSADLIQGERTQKVGRLMPFHFGVCCAWLVVACIAAVVFGPFDAHADFLDSVPLKPEVETPGQQTGKDTPVPKDRPIEKDQGSAEAPSPQIEDSKQSSEQDGTAGQPATSNGQSARGESDKGQKSEKQKGGLFGSDITQHEQDAPVKIEGDLVTGAREKGELHLKGHVILRQANAELRSDEATVFSTPGTTRADRAVAKGNVRFFKKPEGDVPPLRAEADELEYFVSARRIRLWGAPRVWRGQELIEGREIFVELDTGAVTIKGARGVLQPKAMENAN